MPSSLRLLLSALSLALSTAAIACNGEDLTQLTTGTLVVTTITGGAGLDPDGYTIQLDGGQLQPIDIAGSIQNCIGQQRMVIQFGSGGMAPNCVDSGDNPRSVTVTAGETSTVRIRDNLQRDHAPNRRAGGDHRHHWRFA